MKDTKTIQDTFDQLGYVLDEELATVLFLLLHLQKPLLLEGPPGVGKTEVANILAAAMDTELIRLQCYEGLDVHSTVYEWNYQKQLLSIKIQEGSSKSEAEKEAYIFGEDFLLQRPLLKAITAKHKAPVLLIDEIDRADEEFEAFLLELLSAFQISIPEMGTIKAIHKPWVILTSNRTRELSDALKRRCLFHWISYPDLEREQKIVQKHLPSLHQNIIRQLVGIVHQVREHKLNKTPGIAETLDWVGALIALEATTPTVKDLEKSLGCLLKSSEDILALKADGLENLLVEIE